MAELLKKISFDQQIGGYNREQVDCYLEYLTGEYQVAYDEYESLLSKYNDLLAEYKKLRAREGNKPRSEPMSAGALDKIETQIIFEDIYAELNKLDLQIKALRLIEIAKG